jgi:hypothetical protein
MAEKKGVYSYKVKTLVRWGSSGNVVFVTKESKECGIKVGDSVVVSVVADDGEKKIVIEKLPVKMRKRE